MGRRKTEMKKKEGRTGGWEGQMMMGKEPEWWDGKEGKEEAV